MTRLGAKLSSHPGADKETYRHLKKQLKPFEASDIWMEAKDYIYDIVAAVNIFDVQIFKFNFKQLICYYLLFLAQH